jgi:drug/metabolite transporter (DMT)-like permease
MVEIRESLWYRLRWIWILLGVALAVIIAAFMTGAGDATGAAWCRAGYEQATTAADSALIDSQVPVFQSRNASPRVRCGVLRSTGNL